MERSNEAAMKQVEEQQNRRSGEAGRGSSEIGGVAK
jgi:hypothetical protein